MSSRGGVARLFVGAHGSVDSVGEVAFEDPQGLGFAVASSDPAGYQRPGWWMGTELGDRDPVDGRVQLPFATAVQPVPGPVT